MADAIRSVRFDDWNDGVILAEGRHLTHFVNGVVVTEEEDREAAADRLSGAVGFKISSGSKVELKDIRLKKLGAAPSDTPPVALLEELDARPNSAVMAIALSTKDQLVFGGDRRFWEPPLRPTDDCGIARCGWG